MIDRWTALSRISLGEPDLSFPPDTSIEVIHAIGARAEVRATLR